MFIVFYQTIRKKYGGAICSNIVIHIINEARKGRSIADYEAGEIAG